MSRHRVRRQRSQQRRHGRQRRPPVADRSTPMMEDRPTWIILGRSPDTIHESRDPFADRRDSRTNPSDQRTTSDQLASRMPSSIPPRTCGRNLAAGIWPCTFRSGRNLAMHVSIRQAGRTRPESGHARFDPPGRPNLAAELGHARSARPNWATELGHARSAPPGRPNLATHVQPRPAGITHNGSMVIGLLQCRWVTCQSRSLARVAGYAAPLQ